MAVGEETSEPHGALSSLFSAADHTRAYATFRPQYPPHIYQMVLDFAQLPPGQRRLAVDLGSGSGQATHALARLFDRVVGVDASASQLRHAELPANVEMQQAPAEATGLPDQSADLITAAAALHWFDLPAVFREARRILRPGGALAAWTYAGIEARWMPENAEAERLRREVFEEFFPFFHPRLQGLMRQGYAGHVPPPTDFAEAKHVVGEMEVSMSVAQLVGLVRTWSAFLPYQERHGEAAAAARLERYCRELVAALGVPDDTAPIVQVWPVEMVLARQPVPLDG